MSFNIKLTEEGIKKLREELGFDNGKINLSSGIIQVANLELVKEIVKRYDVDNVNKISISLLNVTSPELENEESLDPKSQVDESNIEIGSIIRLKRNERTIHAVVTKMYGTCYDAAKVILDTSKTGRQDEIVLYKGKDVEFKNPTYRSAVKVITNYLNGLQKKDIMYEGKGTVVGKVINEEKMQQIINMIKSKKEQTKGVQECEPETIVEMMEIESVAPNNEVSEEQDSIAETDLKLLKFEEIVETSQNVDELIANLKLEDTVIVDAVKICIEVRKSEFKKMISLLQHKYEESGSKYAKLKQNALKYLLNEQLENWVQIEKVEMKEYTISYMLRTIVKCFKDSKKI